MRSLYAAALAVFLCLPIQPANAADGCRSVDWFLEYLKAADAPHVIYRNPDEVARAVAHYNSSPGGTIEKADAVILAIRPNGGGMIAVFVHGVEACEVLRLPSQEQAEAFIRAVLGIEA